MELNFTEEAVVAVAERALKLKTGARGLRSTIEETLLDVMYNIPSMDNVRRCVVTGDVIEGRRPPILVTRSEREYEFTADRYELPESA